MAGLAWGFLRRREVVTVRATLDAKQPRRLDPLVQLIDAFAQLIIVGSGSSLGREAAPRQLAAVSAQWIAEVCEADFPLRRKNPHARPAIAAPMTGAQRRRQNVTSPMPDVLVETWRPKARTSMAMLILPSSPPITPELTPVRSIAMITITVCCRRCEGGIGLSKAAPEPFLGAEEAVERGSLAGSRRPSASVRPGIGIFRSSWASPRGA